MTASETYLPVVELPQDVSEAIDKLNRDPSRPLRICYLAGPGDVGGTYEHWRQGRHDPRVPVATYSAMFYELIDRIGAEAQVVTAHDAPGGEEQVKFTTIRRPQGSRGRFDYFRARSAYSRDLVAAVEGFDPDIVVIHSDCPSSAWKRLARGRKAILTSHNTFWPMGQKRIGPRARLKYGIISRRLKALDAALCTSDECARQIAELSGRTVKSRVEYPQVLEHYTPISSDRIASMLFLGRIEPNKGIYHLLEAFSSLRAKFPELTLDYAGTGSAEGALREAAASHDGVRVLGRLDAVDVHRVMKDVQLLVCPTTSGFNEGLAIVGFEAAAHGVPSALSAVVPAKDLLAEGCIVFQADSSTAIADAIEPLIEDRSRYEALKAGTSVARELSYDRGKSWGSQLALLLGELSD